jgi:hypothetical protein
VYWQGKSSSHERMPKLWKENASSSTRSTTDAFEYSPLPKKGGMIRLLDLLPGQHGTILECNLREASLYSQSSYKALSYSWLDERARSAEEDVAIICNKKSAVVPVNLHSALQTFRQTTSALTLWVDYLCIDQKNIQERTQQVGMMRSIYSYSSEVLVWLGPNRDGDHIGEGRIVGRGEDGSHKFDWQNDSSDDDMVRLYLNHFDKFETVGHLFMDIPWSRDVFGALCVLNMLARGSHIRDLGFFGASNITSPERSIWSQKISDAFSYILEASWVRNTGSVYNASTLLFTFSLL